MLGKLKYICPNLSQLEFPKQLFTCHDKIDAGTEADPVVEVLNASDDKLSLDYLVPKSTWTVSNKLSLLCITGSGSTS